MNKSLKRMMREIEKGLDYKQFEQIVMKYPKFFLKDCKTWTKLDLKRFYDSIKGVTL